LPGGISKWEPPDPIPNSEVKLLSADDSVGLPHVKVGHCQAFNPNLQHLHVLEVFFGVGAGTPGREALMHGFAGGHGCSVRTNQNLTISEHAPLAAKLVLPLIYISCLV
jgi:hypothetical protein